MDIDLGDGCNFLVLAFYAFTKPWSWIVLGTLLAIGGFIFGTTSHEITYQNIERGSFTPYFVNGGTDYLRENNSSTYYIIHESDFSPSLKRADFFSSGGFTFIARSDSENVDVTFTDGTHLTGAGYQVEQITFFDSTGLTPQVFSTSEYAQHPHGFFEDHWAIGRILIIIGFILAGLTFFITLSRSRVNLLAHILRISSVRGSTTNQQAVTQVLKTFLYTETWSETYVLLEQEKKVLSTERAEQLLVTLITQAQQNETEQSELLYLRLHLQMLRDARRLGIPATVAKHKAQSSANDASNQWKIARLVTITISALMAFINAPWDKKRQILEEEQVLLLTGRADSQCSVLLMYWHNADLELCRFLLRRSREIGISAAWAEFEQTHPLSERVNITPFVGSGPLRLVTKPSPLVRAIRELPPMQQQENPVGRQSQIESKALDHALHAFLEANFWFGKRDVLERELALLLTKDAQEQLANFIARARQADIPVLVKYLEIHVTLLRHVQEVGLPKAWTEFEATYRNAQESQHEERRFIFSSAWTELQARYSNTRDGLEGAHAFCDISLKPLFNEIAAITYPDEAAAIRHPQEIPLRIELLHEMIRRIDAGEGNRVAWAEMQISLAQALEISWIHQPVDKMTQMEEAIHCYRNALCVYTADSFPHEYTKAQVDLGNLYYTRTFGSQRDNQEEAIACYRKALSASDLLSFSSGLNNLGALYTNRIMGDRGDNLKRAVICFYILLTLLDPSSHVAAKVKINLGGVHNTLAKLDSGRFDSSEQEQAITYYREALRVLTQNAYPLEHIRLLNNLGNVYLDRIKGSRSENIEEAISSLQEAQQTCTLDTFPNEYAMLQQNLAAAYQRRTVGKRSENLHKAMDCLRLITHVFTFENDPDRFIDLQFNIAVLAFYDLHDEAEASGDKIGAANAYKIAQQALDAACRAQIELGWLESDEHGRSHLQGQYHAREMYALNAWCLWQLGDLRKAVAAVEGGRTQALVEAFSIQGVSLESLCSRHAVAFAQATQNLQVTRHNGDRAAIRIARDQFLAVRQAIRRCCQPNFLPGEPTYQDIVHAASNQVIVYLVATPRGGVAFIVPPAQAFNDPQEHFPTAIPLPELTLRVINNWLTRVDTDGNAVGGFNLPVQQHSVTLLRNWNNRIGLKTSQQQRMTAPLRNVPEILPDEMSTMRQALRYLVEKWSTRADLLSRGNLQEQEEARMLRRRLAMSLGEVLTAGILDGHHELDWFLQQAELERLLPELSKIIMQPLRQGLNALGLDSSSQPIALIPCGRLSPLPLHAAFVTHPRTGEQVPFQETCEFTYQPSARTLAASHTVAESLPTDGPIIAVGNPAGANLCYAEQEALSNVQQARRKGRSSSIAVVGAEATLSKLQGVFQDTKKQRSGAWVEIAGHGYADPTDPHNSFMLLGGDEKLTLAMLRNEQLLAGVRCFSALGCVTGIIDLKTAPDELTSFAAGVLQAGASSAIATLWSVSDKASFFLMLRFHHVLLDNPTRSPAWILREAVKWLRTATRRDLDEMLNISGVRLSTLIECTRVRGVNIDQLPDGLRGISLSVPIKTSKQTAQYVVQQLKYAQAPFTESNTPFAHPIYWASTIIYGS